MAIFERSVSINLNTPIVFILGFGGSKPSQLLRYSKIYEKKGYETALFVSPILTIRTFNDLWPYAEELYKRANFDREGHRPIIFHVMSMIGITTFACFWELLSQKSNGQRIKSKIVGVIFDSGPMRIATPSCASAAVSVAKYPIKFTDFYSQCMRTYTYFFLFAYYSYLKVLTTVSVKKRHNICTFYRMQQITDLPFNQLYLYSKADPVIDYKQVDEFIKFQEKGKLIQKKCWDDSPHVQHLLKYPEGYKQLCIEFADRLFKEDKSKI